jgi:hypothetical protein
VAAAAAATGRRRTEPERNWKNRGQKDLDMEGGRGIEKNQWQQQQQQCFNSFLSLSGLGVRFYI